MSGETPGSDIATADRVPLQADARTTSGRDTTYVRVAIGDIPAHLARTGGHTTVTILYAVTCPNSQRMFPELARLARDYGLKGVDFRAISTDYPDNAFYIRTFFRKYGAPLSPFWLLPYPPGSLSGAVRSVGVQTTGSTIILPLIVVRDAAGKLVGYSEGVTDLTPLERFLQGGGF